MYKPCEGSPHHRICPGRSLQRLAEDQNSTIEATQSLTTEATPQQRLSLGPRLWPPTTTDRPRPASVPLFSAQLDPTSPSLVFQAPQLTAASQPSSQATALVPPTSASPSCPLLPPQSTSKPGFALQTTIARGRRGRAGTPRGRRGRPPLRRSSRNPPLIESPTK
jgi:hypothetical protein